MDCGTLLRASADHKLSVVDATANRLAAAAVGVGMREVVTLLAYGNADAVGLVRLRAAALGLDTAGVVPGDAEGGYDVWAAWGATATGLVVYLVTSADRHPVRDAALSSVTALCSSSVLHVTNDRGITKALRDNVIVVRDIARDYLNRVSEGAGEEEEEEEEEEEDDDEDSDDVRQDGARHAGPPLPLLVVLGESSCEPKLARLGAVFCDAYVPEEEEEDEIEAAAVRQQEEEEFRAELQIPCKQLPWVFRTNNMRVRCCGSVGLPGCEGVPSVYFEDEFATLVSQRFAGDAEAKFPLGDDEPILASEWLRLVRWLAADFSSGGGYLYKGELPLHEMLWLPPAGVKLPEMEARLLAKYHQRLEEFAWERATPLEVQRKLNVIGRLTMDECMKSLWGLPDGAPVNSFAMRFCSKVSATNQAVAAEASARGQGRAAELFEAKWRWVVEHAARLSGKQMQEHLVSMSESFCREVQHIVAEPIAVLRRLLAANASTQVVALAQALAGGAEAGKAQAVEELRRCDVVLAETLRLADDYERQVRGFEADVEAWGSMVAANKAAVDSRLKQLTDELERREGLLRQELAREASVAEALAANVDEVGVKLMKDIAAQHRAEEEWVAEHRNNVKKWSAYQKEYEEFAEGAVKKLRKQMEEVVERPRKRWWQIGLGVIIGVVGGVLTCGGSLVAGGAFLGAGVKGTIMGIKGASTAEFWKGVAGAGVCGAAGGAVAGVASRLTGQLLTHWGAAGWASNLGANVVGGALAGATSTVVHNAGERLFTEVPEGKEPRSLFDGVGKAMLMGAAGGGVNWCVNGLAQTKAIRKVMEHLEKADKWFSGALRRITRDALDVGVSQLFKLKGGTSFWEDLLFAVGGSALHASFKALGRACSGGGGAPKGADDPKKAPPDDKPENAPPEDENAPPEAEAEDTPPEADNTPPEAGTDNTSPAAGSANTPPGTDNTSPEAGSANTPPETDNTSPAAGSANTPPTAGPEDAPALAGAPGAIPGLPDAEVEKLREHLQELGVALEPAGEGGASPGKLAGAGAATWVAGHLMEQLGMPANSVKAASVLGPLQNSDVTLLTVQLYSPSGSWLGPTNAAETNFMREVPDIIKRAQDGTLGKGESYKVMASSGGPKEVKDLPRLKSQYGAGVYEKVGVKKVVNGQKMQTHAYLKDGKVVVDLKKKDWNTSVKVKKPAGVSVPSRAARRCVRVAGKFVKYGGVALAVAGAAYSVYTNGCDVRAGEKSYKEAAWCIVKDVTPISLIQEAWNHRVDVGNWCVNTLALWGELGPDTDCP